MARRKASAPAAARRRAARTRCGPCRPPAPSGLPGRRPSPRRAPSGRSPRPSPARGPCRSAAARNPEYRPRHRRAATTRARCGTIEVDAMEAVTAPPEVPALDSPELYTNRELSWLQFNERVLELAEDEATPLLERVKFLAIYANNLDEFFMVRVAGLYDQVDAGIDARGPDGLSPSEAIERIVERSRELGHRHSRQWEDHVRPALAEHGIRVIDCEECDGPELEKIDRQFSEQIFPVLTPLAVGPGRPFPYISNLSLSLAVWLRDPVARTETFARVKVPKEVLPRFVPLGDNVYVPLEAVIARNLEQLFPGMEVLRHDFFRVTRDADFTVSDEADDLLQAVEDELRRRRFGELVRLEVASTMDPDMRSFLVEQLAIDEEEVVDVEGLLDLDDLWTLYELEGHRELRAPPWTPVTQAALGDPEHGKADVLAAMSDRDLLV